MPTLPWTVPNTPPQGTEVHVFASRFETRTLWGALKFLAGTPAVWRQVRRSPGAYGATLRAKPFRRTFWTLSAWESKDALHAFVRAGAHGPAARGLAPQMRDASFTTWQASSDDLPITWTEALRRLP
ncbi:MULTISPECIES: DUF3291 domain-containing protein [Streptomyces]|uniref:DUF3291 domain-containing protein n=1 Tax=Streptomyces dubilierae TaxID=3075533 RepID=A0ABU2P9P3_9ACTN|nr:DUF3291 domain-containing protein [Streptomyces sp. DSM 41921]MDT0387510.1 DUF3291 domain-containing protein [Streptomyces sp. DSM 41921]